MFRPNFFDYGLERWRLPTNVMHDCLRKREDIGKFVLVFEKKVRDGRGMKLLSEIGCKISSRNRFSKTGSGNKPKYACLSRMNPFIDLHKIVDPGWRTLYLSLEESFEHLFKL